MVERVRGVGTDGLIACSRRSGGGRRSGGAEVGAGRED